MICWRVAMCLKLNYSFSKCTILIQAWLLPDRCTAVKKNSTKVAENDKYLKQVLEYMYTVLAQEHSSVPVKACASLNQSFPRANESDLQRAQCMKGLVENGAGEIITVNGINLLSCNHTRKKKVLQVYVHGIRLLYRTIKLQIKFYQILKWIEMSN